MGCELHRFTPTTLIGLLTADTEQRCIGEEEYVTLDVPHYDHIFIKKNKWNRNRDRRMKIEVEAMICYPYFPLLL